MVRNDIRHLILARPGGNLDYKSQKGYGYHSNHPLGNWAKFYGIENGKLVEQSDPIRHRE